SEVKRSIADGSVVFRHVRVGHRQASIPKALIANAVRAFFVVRKKEHGILYLQESRARHCGSMTKTGMTVF
ncbi:hypothetical protein, partial [uncultured Microbulbifer sp.]|uniref:hypothetical protein n=1 Tax=uncultured Microbulbifer sp. TaxID=348147 RepID=UPI00263110D4